MSEAIDFSWLPYPLSAEIAELSQHLGPPLLGSVDLGNSAYLRHVVSGRCAEVCMVVRRASGRILVLRKPFYPAGIFRLMTGGIGRGETILDALLRETHEETGLTVEVACFLAASTYATDGHPQFASFAFLLEECGGTLGALDPDERVEAFREVMVANLPDLARALESLDDAFDTELDAEPRQWGLLRALNHRLVHQALS